MIPAGVDRMEIDQAREHAENTEPRCYPLSAIPAKFACVFPYASFNKIQSGCLYDVWFDKKSLVVAAPTGSGKTGILELALCRAWEDFGQSMLAVYMGPTRSLVRERVSDWRNKFAELGVKIIELTGDADPSSAQPVATDAHLICTTPEKWDVQWRSGRKQVSLYLIDEVHSIGEPERGPLLEAVLTRTVVRPHSKKFPPRFVAVSATVANPGDIATWLGRNVDCKVREFDATTKACPVHTLVKGFPCPPAKSSYSFDIGLDFKLPGIITDHAPRGKSTLVFVTTRNAAVQCAKRLAHAQPWFTVRTLESSLLELQRSLSDNKLIEVVQRGVAFHHAGLNLRDRILVEESFVKGIVGVLVTTSTLAMGVNLPAYLVVIRGTTMYNGGTTSEYSSSKILQMIGRAGRIQFESSGQAVILTKQQNAARYEALLSGKLENVESFLQQDLMRHLNAEIALGNVKTLSDCVDWLKCTYFYVRAEARSRSASKSAEFETFLEEQTREALEVLKAHGIISMEDNIFCKTALGCAFNRSCLSFHSFSSLMTALREPPPEGGFSARSFLRLISALPDFENAQIRLGDKSVLRKLNSRLLCKVTEKPPTWKSEHKIFILLQSLLESVEILDSTSLRLERMSMMKVAKRASWCLYECILILWQQLDLREAINVRLTFTMVCSISLLAKSCRCEMWYDSKFCVQQLEEIGSTRARRLVESGYINFDSITNAEPGILEIITKTNPPFGSRLQQQVMSKIPRYLLHWDLIDETPIVSVELRNADTLRERSSASIIVGDQDDAVYEFKRLTHEELLRKNIFRLEVDPNWQQLQFCLINEAKAGVDKDGIIEKPNPGLSSSAERQDQIPGQLPGIRNRGRAAETAECNAWLAAELETTFYEESEDALSAIFRARAEELFRDFDDSGDQTTDITAGDSMQIADVRDGSPDSLEEILDRHYGAISCDLESNSRSLHSNTVTARKRTVAANKKTPKPKALKPSERKRSEVVKTASRPARKRKKTSDPIPVATEGAATDAQEECTMATSAPEFRYSDPPRKNSLEISTDPVVCDPEVCEHLPQPHIVDETGADDGGWEAYLRDTTTILKEMLSE